MQTLARIRDDVQNLMLQDISFHVNFFILSVNGVLGIYTKFLCSYYLHRSLLNVRIEKVQ